MAGQAEGRKKEYQPILIFEKDRLDTFKENWTDLGFKYCTPENFAATGFYNCNRAPPDDTVKCFSCLIELHDWEEGDDPWKEHMKRGEKCPFVSFRKKENPTLRDFLDLQFESKKAMLSKYFEDQKKVLHEKETMLLKKITDCSKGKK